MFQSPITHPANIVLAQNVLQCEPVSLYTMWSCVAVHNVQLCRCIQCEAVSLYTMCSCVAVYNVKLCRCTQCAAVSLYTMCSCATVHNVQLCRCIQCEAVSLYTMWSCVAVHNVQLCRCAQCAAVSLYTMRKMFHLPWTVQLTDEGTMIFLNALSCSHNDTVTSQVTWIFETGIIENPIHEGKETVADCKDFLIQGGGVGASQN